MELASDCRDAGSGKDSESTWLSQCFLANRGKWGGRASKLLNRTWRVIYGRLCIGISRCTHPQIMSILNNQIAAFANLRTGGVAFGRVD